MKRAVVSGLLAALANRIEVVSGLLAALANLIEVVSGLLPALANLSVVVRAGLARMDWLAVASLAAAAGLAVDLVARDFEVDLETLLLIKDFFVIAIGRSPT